MGGGDGGRQGPPGQWGRGQRDGCKHMGQNQSSVRHAPLPRSPPSCCTCIPPTVCTEVVLAANTFPSINDVTAGELEPLLESAAAGDATVLGPAVAGGRVRVVANGTDTPVIDLRRLSPELCEEAQQAGGVTCKGGVGGPLGTRRGGGGGDPLAQGGWWLSTPLHEPSPSWALALGPCPGQPLPTLARAAPADLVVLEGMGRGIETNLRAAFRCDAACLALIKHPEVATCLGGRLYDVVCSFRPAPAAGQGQ